MTVIRNQQGRIMASRAAVAPWRLKLAKWCFDRSFYREVGLKYDDCLKRTDVVKEAVQRLPKDMYDARYFRTTRAVMLSSRKEVLPEAEWTRFEEDDRYLAPYIAQVEKEHAEKQEWDKK